MSATQSPLHAEQRFVIEKDERLSRSILWGIQRKFYEARGVDAWAGGALPYYITSNPAIANAYARVVLAFLSHCVAASGATPRKPVQIIEIGSGSGRFAFYFLKKLTNLSRELGVEATRFRYIMTDLAQSNVDFWRNHAGLQPFVEAGLLDFARFDAANPKAIELQSSGEVLAPGDSPVVVIANYVLDSIPQDGFYISGGRLYESLITLSSTCEEPDLLDPAIIERIHVDYRNVAVASDYYADSEFDDVLNYYRETLADTNVTFPCAALRCIRDLGSLSDGRMLLLCGDKGLTREESLLGNGAPGIVVHGGAFSLLVNFNAIGRYFRNRGGREFYTSHRSASIAICAFLQGIQPSGYDAIGSVFNHVMEECGPNDIFNIVRMAPRSENAAELVSLVRLSGWDHEVLMAGFAPMMEPENRLNGAERIEAYRMIRQVWDQYYPIGESNDLAFNLAGLLVELDYCQEATEFLGISAARYGMSPGTAFNLSLCHYRLGQLDKALEHASRALALDPDFDEAKALRITIMDQMV